MSIRCFIAIELPGEIKQGIASRTEALRKCGADAKWVNAENLHLTLKFLGNIPEDKPHEIDEALKKAVNGHSEFTMRLIGAGVFPDRQRPRVVWLGIEDSGRLAALQSAVEKAMAEAGFEPENRPFSPHLTIGRLKSPRRREILLKELDALSAVDFGSVKVAEVALMKSTLNPSGAEYSRLIAIPLAGCSMGS